VTKLHFLPLFPVFFASEHLQEIVYDFVPKILQKLLCPLQSVFFRLTIFDSNLVEKTKLLSKTAFVGDCPNQPSFSVL